ncbi:hypothetical protein V8B97DRAFT_689255 [Scleroderma yunnanense]
MIARAIVLPTWPVIFPVSIANRTLRTSSSRTTSAFPQSSKNAFNPCRISSRHRRRRCCQKPCLLLYHVPKLVGATHSSSGMYSAHDGFDGPDIYRE